MTTIVAGLPEKYNSFHRFAAGIFGGAIAMYLVSGDGIWIWGLKASGLIFLIGFAFPPKPEVTQFNAPVQPENPINIPKNTYDKKQFGCLWGTVVFAIVFMMFCVSSGWSSGTNRPDPAIEAKKPDFQEWAKNNFSVTELILDSSTIRVRMAPEMYSTPRNAEGVARTIARAWKARTGRDANCRVFDAAGRSEIASSWPD